MPMNDAEEIRRTIAGYVQRLDEQNFVELVELFVPDGVLELGGGRRRKGRAELLAMYESNRSPSILGKIKHLTFNTVLELDREPVRALSDFLEIAKTSAGTVVSRAGRYDDTLVRDGDRWRFQSRVITSSGWSPPDGDVIRDFGDWPPKSSGTA